MGDVKEVNANLYQQLLAESLVPVCCALTHDGNEQLLNTNADTITAEIGKSLAKQYATKINYCFELPRVMGRHPQSRFPHRENQPRKLSKPIAEQYHFSRHAPQTTQRL